MELSSENLHRILNFLEKPGKNLGTIVRSMDTATENIYSKFNVKTQQSLEQTGNTSTSTRSNINIGLDISEPIQGLEKLPELNETLGCMSRFGDGDGSYWDRWLNITGYTLNGKYRPGSMPSKGTYSSGQVLPRSGFKRYQLDRLQMHSLPTPRVQRYSDYIAAKSRTVAERSSRTMEKSISIADKLSNSIEKTKNTAKFFPLSKTPKGLPLKITDNNSTITLDEEVNNSNLTLEKMKFDNSVIPDSTMNDVNCPLDKPMNSSNNALDMENHSPNLILSRSYSVPHLKPIQLANQATQINLNTSDSSTKTELYKKKLESLTEFYDTFDGFSSGNMHDMGNVDCLECADDKMADIEIDEIYFGSQGKLKFFDMYKNLSRKRNNFSKSEELLSLEATEDKNKPQNFSRSLEKSEIRLSTEKNLDKNFKIFPDIKACSYRTSSTKQDNAPNFTVASVSSNFDMTEASKQQIPNFEVGKEEIPPLNNLENMPKLNENSGVINQITPRTKFLYGCIDAQRAPRANIVIRRFYMTQIDLSHMSMGDELGILFGACLADLPHVLELSLCNNRLTDTSIVPILRAIKEQAGLTALDLSENRCCSGAAQELAKFLGDKHIKLCQLKMSGCHLDDEVTSLFVEPMRNNTTLTYLDLSRNLIGKQESVNYVNPAFYTGAEALADWLESDSCQLVHLDLSWNTIRLGSALQFGTALAKNTKLQILKLGYNGFGQSGGEGIGAALSRNQSLKTIDLTANRISPRAAIVIAEGIIANKSLIEISMGNNPLGKQGARWVTRIPGEMSARGVRDFKIDVSGSNFQIEDPLCWFNDAQLESIYTLKLEEPYERAIACYLVRRMGRDPGLTLMNLTLVLSKKVSTSISLIRKKLSYSTSSLHKELLLVQDPSRVFDTLDSDRTGILNRKKIAQALIDVGLKDPKEADFIFSQYDSFDSGRIERSEFLDYVAMRREHMEEVENMEDMCVVSQSQPTEQWIPPFEGTLKFEFKYVRHLHQGHHTTEARLDAMMALFNTITDGLTFVMDSALSNMTLDAKLGNKLYNLLLRENGGLKTKAMIRVLPCMSRASEARLLVLSTLKSWDERKQLWLELGPAYRAIFGLAMGRYRLDLNRDTHRLCAQQILAVNNMQKMENIRRGRFDTSQKGNWENIRNEKFNGNVFTFAGDSTSSGKCPERFDCLPTAGLMEFDYVNTSICRKETLANGLSNRRYIQILQLAGLINSREAEVLEDNIDEKISNVLSRCSRYPLDREFPELLHVLYSGVRGPDTTALSMKEQAVLGTAYRPEPSNSELFNLNNSKKDSPFDIFEPQEFAAPNDTIVQLEHLVEEDKSSESVDLKTEIIRAFTPKGISKVNLNLNLNILSPCSIAVMHLEELLCNRSISTEQLSFAVICLIRKFSGESKLSDLTVDLVISLYPFISNLTDIIDVIMLLRANQQASLFQRVGWLNLWNPVRPEGYTELNLALREERQVAKMAIHLLLADPATSWSQEEYFFKRYRVPLGGWVLPKNWCMEKNLPHRGILRFYIIDHSSTCSYTAPPGKRPTSNPKVFEIKTNWNLRCALCETVVLPDPPSNLTVPNIAMNQLNFEWTNYIDELCLSAGLEFTYRNATEGRMSADSFAGHA